MKYVLMFTSRPDLDDAVEPERAKEVYGRNYCALALTDNPAEQRLLRTRLRRHHLADGG